MKYMGMESVMARLFPSEGCVDEYNTLLFECTLHVLYCGKMVLQFGIWL
jgi:hypothetical protein